MQKFIRLILIFFLLLIGTDMFSSPQLPDYLVFKGDTFPVYDLILEKYIETQDQSEKESLFGLKFRDGASLNCWRGYQAIYQIDKDSLFLSSIISCGELFFSDTIDQIKSHERINNLFNTNGRVHIDWFSGKISLPKGDLLRWDGVFYKIYEQEILIDIDKGLIKNVRAVDNYIDAPTRIDRRYKDTISTVLFKSLKRIKWRHIDKCDCSEKYLVTINKNGVPSKVIMPDYQTKDEIKEFWELGEYNYCINRVLKGLKTLKFDIIKHKGKRISEDVLIELWFEENGDIENWTE